MLADCHIHMVLDGIYYRDAIDAHRQGPREDLIRSRLEAYKNAGFTYLRDGGDRWGVGVAARSLAGEYGITYRTPVFPIHKTGHYGGFIGCGYSTWDEYEELLAQVRRGNGDFVKLMISGLMDFNCFGVLTGAPLAPDEIRQLIWRAHDRGYRVMVHANGAETVIAAAEAGVDSVEHGAYLNEEALHAMKEAGAIWVPTLSTIGNLLETDRFPHEAVQQILDCAMENVSHFHAMGGLLAPGTDAGAYAVPHACLSEYRLLEAAIGPQCHKVLAAGIKELQNRF